ncbi:phage tail protein [Actinobacillus equuli subsp. equuli]|uniref:phage tail protein n=1 Tax=Actinobacillus equuli TaxID=718 RepID=UPI0024432696|nr:phage tail protein [Actinobacillus equuli]WGE65573.1 phage tail protein [Actinobacillus equuli subsp. equuli]
MANISGYIATSGKSISCKDTGYLDRLPIYRGEARIAARLMPTISGKLQQGKLLDLAQPAQAYIVPNYYSDLYSRVLVIPHTVNLGSISTEQVFDVHVWNANRHSINLTKVDIQDGEGITLAGSQTPLTLRALALKKWTVKVGMNGPAEIDCTVTFTIAGKNPVTLRITGSRSTDWEFFPDWSEDVTEKLEFLTTVHQSMTGAEQRIAKRLSPRRTFEFKVSTTGTERQRLENMLYAYGARVWAMPIFTHQVYLDKPTQQGDKTLSLATTGFDFYIGGRAVLMNGNKREMVDITGIQPDKLEIKRPLLNRFDTSTQVYPLRSAVLTDMPQLTRLSDGVATAQIRLQIHEHNGYASDISHLPTYRGHPVLEPTSEWSEDITAQYLRLIKQLDNGTALPHYLDTAKNAFQLTNHRFLLNGIAEQHQLRQLFYALRGRQKAIWVASSTNDLTLTSDIVGKSINIELVYYTTCLLKQAGRQDIRIECTDGTVHYRRILAATISDNQTERFSLDGEALNLKREQVAKISFLTLSRLESDTIDWKHHTDSVASVMVSFRGLRDELEV